MKLRDGVSEYPVDHAIVFSLAHGCPPEDDVLLSEMTVGIDSIVDFWEKRYHQEYIPAGGSKIKFITGRSGSGKTHPLRLIQRSAREHRFISVSFSAQEVWLHDFKEVYVRILQECHLEELMVLCSHRIIEALGFDHAQIPDGMTFLDHLSQVGLADALTRREIRMQLKTLFLDNTALDNNFALACSLLCGGILGHPILEVQSRQTLLAWFEGDKSVKAAGLRALGLAPSRLTKFNARHMLRSLAEIVRLAGYSGIQVCIDDLEVLIDRSSMNPMHYTKMKRDDTYESIRQLIDDIDTFRHLLIVFAFDSSLLTDEQMGIKSYQALWMRIQNEIVSTRLNLFADILDMDTVSAQLFSPPILVKMSSRLASAVNMMNMHARAIDESEAREILAIARHSELSVPALVQRATMTVEGELSHDH